MIGRLAGRIASLLPRTGGGNDGEGGSVWDAIPTWQYEGLHVHQGGLSRSDQEEAIAEVHQRAAEIDRGPFREEKP